MNGLAVSHFNLHSLLLSLTSIAASEQNDGALQRQPEPQVSSDSANRDDYDVPPPLLPPQMHNEGQFEPTDRSASRGSFYAQL